MTNFFLKEEKKVNKRKTEREGYKDQRERHREKEERKTEIKNGLKKTNILFTRHCRYFDFV